MFNKSMANAAYELMSKRKKAKPFAKLYDEVAKNLGMSEQEKQQNISNFYTQLTIDGRFINVGENTWDLKERYNFEQTHVDMTDAYEDSEDIEEYDDEDEEEDYDDEEKIHASKDDLDGFHVVDEDEED